MRDQNVEFLEHYKRLDTLCKEMLDSNEGVSSYICEMETTPYETTAEISAWDTTYKQIKNFRWMRNQLVHEISIDDDFCTKEDIDSIKKLYELIVNTQDPLSIASRSKQNDYYYSNNNTNSKNQDSVWNKIVSKIKGWLS